MRNRIIAIVTISAILVVSAIAAVALRVSPPDVTYAPCSLWENGATPVLPEYTYLDRCIDTEHGNQIVISSRHSWK